MGEEQKGKKTRRVVSKLSRITLYGLTQTSRGTEFWVNVHLSVKKKASSNFNDEILLIISLSQGDLLNWHQNISGSIDTWNDNH